MFSNEVASPGEDFSEVAPVEDAVMSVGFDESSSAADSESRLKIPVVGAGCRRKMGLPFNVMRGGPRGNLTHGHGDVRHLRSQSLRSGI